MNRKTAEAIRTVLAVIDAAGSLLDNVDMDDAQVTWDEFEQAIETLQDAVEVEL